MERRIYRSVSAPTPAPPPPPPPAPAAAPLAPPGAARSRLGMMAESPLILIALMLVALYFARIVLIPLAIALSLNFLLTPAVMQIERVRVPRILAVLLVVLMAFSLVGGVGWIVARQVIAVINYLPNYRENIHEKLTSMHPPTSGVFGRTITSLREIGAEVSSATEPKQQQPQPLPHTRRERERARLEAEKQPIPVTVVTPPPSAGEYFVRYARPALEPLGVVLMVVIFTFYMLLKRESLRNRLLLLGGMGQLNLMSQALNEAATRISRYLVLNVLMNACYGVVFGVALYLLHVPNATLWGTLMGILRMIPYAGTLISAAVTVAFTLAVFSGWLHALWVLLLFAGLEFLVANFIEPHIYGRGTGISAFALVVMAIVWTLLWGWPGLIVSTPMTVCLIVIGRHIPRLSFLHTLLGEEAELSPQAHFYERLLAMDEQEARAIGEEFLREHTLAEFYDTVMLPAVVASEQDRNKGALDEVHSGWLYRSVSELVAELSEYKSAPDEEEARIVEASIVAPGLEHPPERACPVACLPVEDEADEIAGTMLAQLLERWDHQTMLLMPAALTEEILSRLSQAPRTIICISAVPPFAFTRARRLVQRLRESLPKNPLVVGLWGEVTDVEVIRSRFGSAHPDAIVTTLRDALTRVRELDARNAAPAEGEQGITPE